MAIAYDASSRAHSTWKTNVTSVTWSHTNAGNFLVVVIGTFDGASGDLCTGITFNGVSMTKVTGVDGAVEGSKQYLSIWKLNGPYSGTADIVASFSTSVDYMFGFGTSYVGVDDVNTSATNSASSGTLSVSMTTTVDNCWLSGGFWSRAGAISVSAGTTQRQSTDAWNNSVDSNAAKTPAGAHTLNATAASGTWWGVAVALSPSATPSTIYLKGRPRNRYDFTGISLG